MSKMESASSTYTFMDIFQKDIYQDGSKIQIKDIVIPIIQRDYAQGRQNNSTKRVRTRFLNALYSAVTGEPIVLDFIYGTVDENGKMIPLDGQQRLTTLFLLYWYAAKKSSIDSDRCLFLKHFSYETRYSARDFCSLLVEFTPMFKNRISEEIIDEAWFPIDWYNDPTINSMLVMLDEIDLVFKDVDNLWGRLMENAISFYFLPIKNMGLTEDIYIKINSRGKPLTNFENFKAELERNLELCNEGVKERIANKIDTTWTDLLWTYRGSSKDIDNKFLNYFRFICDTIAYMEDTVPNKNLDEIDLVEKYFGYENSNLEQHVELLEKFFDCWVELDKSPKEFFESIISEKHELNKIKWDKTIDLLEDCLNRYEIIVEEGPRFTLNKYVLLYAFVCYLCHKDKIKEENFVRNIRVIANLIKNSQYEISDRSNLNNSNNRIPAILMQTKNILLNGQIDDDIKLSYNVFQLEEEKNKIKWCNENPDRKELLFELEDHPLLNGQISILGLENIDLAPNFISLFNCNKDKINCSLLICGNYIQNERCGWRYQFGIENYAESWRALFHNSSNGGVDKTRECLIKLLKTSNSFNDNYLQNLIVNYLNECENNMHYEWKYYYIKYKEFRNSYYGKYYWDDFTNKPYEMTVMQTRTKLSENSYQPFLYVIDRRYINRDNYGSELINQNVKIQCFNSYFLVISSIDDKVQEKINIEQKDGIDCVNRIEFAKDKIKQYLM